MSFKKLIITADDLGASADANRAVMDARRHGVVTSVGFAGTGAALDEAAAWAKSDPALGAGVHLDLERYFNVDPRRPSSLWHFQDPRIPVPAIEADIDAQFRAVTGRGVAIQHVSARHHLHLRPELLPLVCAAAKNYGATAVRFFDGYYKVYNGVSAGSQKNHLARRALRNAPHFLDGWYWGNVDEPFQTAELACRPSHGDDAGRRDLAACCDAGLRDYLARQKIDLITYSAIDA